MIDGLLVVKALPLIFYSLLAPFFMAAAAYGLFLWFHATLFLRYLEPQGHWLAYPFQIVNGLLYLCRLTANGFLRYGRRPGNPHFGFYQPGQLYAWRSGIYEEDETRHNWMPQYFRHWVMATNSVLFDSWLGEQNMSRFFRWGSFVRYLYLWAYYVRLASLRWLAAKVGSSELFFLWTTTFWRLWPVVWRWLSLPFWVLSQGAFRWVHALAAEAMVGVAFRFFRLEPWLRLQWFQQQNVDLYDSPEKLYRRPLPLSAYGFLWYGHQRQQSRRRYDHGRYAWLHVLSSFFSFLLLVLLLCPWALLSVFLAATFSFYRRFNQLQYLLLRRALRFPLAAGQTMALRFFSVISFFASFTVNFWGLLLEGTLALARWLGRSLLVVALMLLLFTQQLPSDFFGFLGFGLGSLFWDFLASFLSLPWTIVTEHYRDLSFHTHVSRYNYWELLDERQEAAFYYLGNAYHGHQMCGIPTCVVELPNPPWLPPKRKPEIWVSWWHRLENHWYWKRLVPDAAAADHRPAADYLYLYQQTLYEAWSTAALAINQEQEEVLTFMSFFGASWWDLLYTSPLMALTSAFNYIYYYLAYRLFYSRPGFFWLRLVWWNPFYGFCLALSLVADWAIGWPLYRLRLIIRRLALVTALAGYFFRAVFGALQTVVTAVAALPPILGQLWPQTATVQRFSLSLPLLAPMEGNFWQGLGLVWNLTVGWFFWYGSIIFDELLRPAVYVELWSLAKSPSTTLLYLWQLSLFRPWPMFSLEAYRKSFWTMSLSCYLWLQLLWDRLYLPLQLPRTFDDYTLSYRYREPCRESTPPLLLTSAHKGMLAVNRHWKLPPVFLYHYSAHIAKQIYEPRPRFFFWLGDFVPYGWLKPRWADFGPQDLRTLDFSYVPHRLHDGLNLILALFPWLYLAVFFLSMAFFPGVSALLFDRQLRAPTAMFNRQWAWDGCRQGEGLPLDQYEALYCRLPSVALVDTKVPWDYVWTPRSLSFFRRSHGRFLRNQGWPRHVLDELQGRRSLGGGRAWPMPYFHEERRLWIPFARYLFWPKYGSIRQNFLDEGIAFLRFISLNYRRSPWVALAFNQYDQYDYQTWLNDSNLDFAARAVQAGATTRRHLEQTDRWLFQKQLGHWVWYKDIGIHEFEQTSSVKDWQEQAFELEDKDQEAYYPWGPLWWFLLFPLFFFGQLYLLVESPYGQDPLFAGGGTLELRNFLLWMHSVAGHCSMFYEQMEWRGWWLLPEYQRSDTALTDPDELPIGGYYERWHKGAISNFYPVPSHGVHYHPASTAAPLGTSQPFGLLEEYSCGRRLIQLLPFLLLPFVIRYRGPRPLPFTLALHRRWPLFAEKSQQYRHLLLWFWK